MVGSIYFSLSLLGWVKGTSKAFVNQKSISFEGHTHTIDQITGAPSSPFIKLFTKTTTINKNFTENVSTSENILFDDNEKNILLNNDNAILLNIFINGYVSSQYSSNSMIIAIGSENNLNFRVSGVLNTSINSKFTLICSNIYSIDGINIIRTYIGPSSTHYASGFSMASFYPNTAIYLVEHYSCIAFSVNLTITSDFYIINI